MREWRITSTIERRIDTRVNIHVPLRFRILTTPASPEQIAESENISQRGVYFSTAFPLKIGTPVEVSLRMPKELVGHGMSDIKCLARVVHVRGNRNGGGKLGIGLRIERVEARVAQPDRWAS